MKRITAKVVYMDFEDGFWGLETSDGQQFKPVPFPEQLKYQDLMVSAMVEDIDLFDMHMWGRPVKVRGYKILSH